MSFCEIIRCIHYFDKDGDILEKDCVPYNPLIVLFNNDADHFGTKYGFDEERTLKNNNLLYPVYVLRYIKKDWDWMDVDKKLEAWSPDGSQLGTAMVVMGVKVVLYCSYRYDYVLNIEKNLGSNYWGKNYFHYNYNGKTAFDEIVQRLCKYLGVTYRGKSPYYDIHINGRYGRIEESPNLTDVTFSIVYEALYSLAYALWHNLDWARDRWRVDLSYIKKYSKLTNEDFPKRGVPFSHDESFYGALKSAYDTYNRVLNINDSFQSLLFRSGK